MSAAQEGEGWGLGRGGQGKKEHRVKEGGEKKRTFSSSLRFSLRFFRRRAISARRMACSSAVRIFFCCGSVCSIGFGVSYLVPWTCSSGLRN